ncbi:alpha/beta hydrolase [Spirosoma sp. KNUC1025]|uniref:alpha/beta hydrolase n=1 Tax=Spirosoma sp. KNUC1025 TaxID=2894082 RepID=UPI00386F31F1|nr:alpha/beta hydrolase [Spirosoma sp. KNUC1025]
MRHIFCQILVLLVATGYATAQNFLPLWPVGKMPNSKGIALTDSIANERVYRVGTPGMYTFFPSAQENKGAAVIICPGGGYERLAYVISGWQLAKWLNTLGISAFVLNYRLPNSPDLKQRELGPLQDAQRAVQLVRSNASKWGIKTDKVGIMGVSAGGHLAALLATSTKEASALGDSTSRNPFRPDFAILISPVITMGQYAHAGSRKNLLGPTPSPELLKSYSLENAVTSTTPPCFLVHAFNDTGVDQRNSLLFYQALVDKKITSSLHIFPQGAHAIALRNNPGSTQEWVSLCENWLMEMNFIPAIK